MTASETKTKLCGESNAPAIDSFRCIRARRERDPRRELDTWSPCVTGSSLCDTSRWSSVSTWVGDPVTCRPLASARLACRRVVVLAYRTELSSRALAAVGYFEGTKVADPSRSKARSRSRASARPIRGTPDPMRADVRWCSIAYQVVGDGPRDLVWVPGWVSHLEAAWEEPTLARFFDRLASFSRLI